MMMGVGHFEFSESVHFDAPSLTAQSFLIKMLFVAIFCDICCERALKAFYRTIIIPQLVPIRELL